jgi:hypothetical protein
VKIKHLSMDGNYQKNMAKTKGGLPIFLESINTNFTILCNVWVEDSGHEIACIPPHHITKVTKIRLLNLAQ